MHDAPCRRLGIVGLGLIGGSIALGMRARWPEVAIVAVDRAPVIDAAEEIVDVWSDDLGALAETDLIVLAAPIRQNQALLGELPAHVKGTAIVTDAGSTKREIVGIGRTLPERLTFVGGHPLGGAAAGGLANARADLFAGRPWILTPGAGAPERAIGAVEALACGLGARPARLDAEEHDRLLAFVSHLPQLAASALMYVIGEAVEPRALALSGRGLADTTRLASSPAAIWQDIAGTNADHIAPALDALIDVLQTLRGDLAGGGRLVDIFRTAAAARARLDERPPV